MTNHIETGKQGELAARTFLERKGFEILECNYRYSRAEVDLIAQYENLIVFVEVKARSDDYFGNPEDSVDDKKEELMAEAAENYLAENNLETEVRFDILSVLFKNNGTEIHHIEDAFFPY